MTDALWAAVDAITKESEQRIHRDQAGEAVGELTGSDRFCRVDTYRGLVVTHGRIPSLWRQAEMALTTGSEASGGKPSPLATRSPADMDLMEIMLTIRETLSDQFVGRRVKPRTQDPQQQIRELAALVVTHEPDHIEWWTYRFQQWARLLGVYLKAVETGPKAMRLRVRCPLCKTEHITIPDPNVKDQKIVVRPILASYRDGMFRCFECQACTASWFAGAGVYELHAAIEADTPEDSILHTSISN